jgi:hypothetical protein
MSAATGNRNRIGPSARVVLDRLMAAQLGRWVDGHELAQAAELCRVADLRERIGRLIEGGIVERHIPPRTKTGGGGYRIAEGRREEVRVMLTRGTWTAVDGNGAPGSELPFWLAGPSAEVLRKTWRSQKRSVRLAGIADPDGQGAAL